jgi:hypothetical protein
MYPHGSRITAHRDQAALHRKRSHARQDIAAVGRGINPVSTNYNLGEQEVNIRIAAARRTYDGHLTGEGIGTTEAVYLASAAPHQVQQNAVSHCDICRHILCEQIDSFGATSSQLHKWNFELFQSCGITIIRWV